MKCFMTVGELFDALKNIPRDTDLSFGRPNDDAHYRVFRISIVGIFDPCSPDIKLCHCAIIDKKEAAEK